ncbi:hypothetical protein KOR42_11320 [Thalassoglobus neptunius]|uniref:DUF58 domain-containing protein n=1 Tax=Thalassoglobus neptunius TaxID=1938619 RepID=A0A5C5X453_9PLAN|nr:DUF58 domain-containing protein [Thalassoglobus neptunius]TWT57766.1 hypothetical protein KOR42_11320 [Thalassoglobus neptunius]
MEQRRITPETLTGIESLKLRTKIIVEGLLSGSHRGQDRGFSVDFAEHRDYSPGDDVRFLDWKLSGRRDRFYIRQFEDENQLTVTLLIDNSGSMTYCSQNSQMSKLEYATTLAASLMWVTCEQRDLSRLMTFDGEQHLGSIFGRAGLQRGFDELENILESATQNSDQKSEDDEHWGGLGKAVERIPRKSIVVLLTDAFGDLDSLNRILARLRQMRCDVRLVQIIDPAEATFPFEGSVLFRDLEGQGEQVAIVDAIRSGYLAEFEQFQHQLGRIVGSMGGTRVVVETDSAFNHCLRRILERGNSSGR